MSMEAQNHIKAKERALSAWAQKGNGLVRCIPPSDHQLTVSHSVPVRGGWRKVMIKADAG